MGVGLQGHARPGALYVPTQGSVDLYYTSTVALSYEEGCIRKFLTAGYLTCTFHVGQEVYDAVQDWAGWANYADTGGVQAVSMGGWTQLTCNTLGTQTNTGYLPKNITKLWDPITNLFDFTELRVGDTLSIRVDLTVTPSMNNSAFQTRIWFLSFGGWFLTEQYPRFADGAGIPYNVVQNYHFYIGSNEVCLNGARLEATCACDIGVVVNSLYIIKD